MRSRLLLAAIAAVFIAGCSGGGGSAVPPVTSGTLSSARTQTQSAATAILDTVQGADIESVLFVKSIGVVLGPLSPSLPPPIPNCTNRHTRTVTQVSQTEAIVDTKYYYDAACTQLAKEVNEDVSQPSSSNETIARSVTAFNQAGTQLWSRKINYDATGSQGNYSSVIQSAFYIGTSGAPFAQHGRQVTVAPQSSMVYTTSENGAMVVNDNLPSVDESFGFQGLLQNGSATLDQSHDVTFAGTHTETFSVGPLGSITISSGPPFSVSGGSGLGSTTVNGSIEFNSMEDLVSVAENATLANGDSVVVSSSGTPPAVSVNGTITNGQGQQVAAFSVDMHGDGTITFADGSQGLILDWRFVQ